MTAFIEFPMIENPYTPKNSNEAIGSIATEKNSDTDIRKKQPISGLAGKSNKIDQPMMNSRNPFVLAPIVRLFRFIKIYQLRIRVFSVEHSPEKLCRDLPVEFLTFATHLKNLSYADRPNYRLLKELMSTASGRFNKPWPVSTSQDQATGAISAELDFQEAPSLGSSVSHSIQYSMDEDRIIYDWLVKDCSHLCHLYCET
uniref:Uncharacterized protein n=1 Tax=Romanomermis culicivorax TaxID=13658 RepID=A0A915IR21_ROMCU